MATNGTTIVRRQLGRRLLTLRRQSGKTREDVQAAEICSVTTLWRIETGKIPVKAGTIYALATIYGLDPPTVTALATLAQGTRSTNWWEEFSADVVPDWLGLYAGLESVASIVANWTPNLVHGLVQTPSYARAIIGVDKRLSADTIDKRVAFRLQRQQAVLSRADVQIKMIMGAAALFLPVGSVEVMREQAEHLRHLSASGRALVRIIPWAAGAHASMKGAFTILDFADPDDPTTVYVENHVGARYLEEARHVAEYRRVFGELLEMSVPIEEYNHERFDA